MLVCQPGRVWKDRDSSSMPVRKNLYSVDRQPGSTAAKISESPTSLIDWTDPIHCFESVLSNCWVSLHSDSFEELGSLLGIKQWNLVLSGKDDWRLGEETPKRRAELPNKRSLSDTLHFELYLPGIVEWSYARAGELTTLSLTGLCVCDGVTRCE